jgi:hypothetical protein
MAKPHWTVLPGIALGALVVITLLSYKHRKAKGLVILSLGGLVADADKESPQEALWQQRPAEEIFQLAVKSVRFEQAFSRFLAGRRFCISHKGYIGWVHSACRPGDQICVFEGCRVLFAIRPQGDGYQLLGDCYLHGLMDGGAMELPWAEMKQIKLA